MLNLSPRRADETRPRNTRRERIIAIVSITALVISCGYLGWSWKTANSPGTRAYEQGMEYASAKHYDLAEKAWRDGIRQDPKAWQCYERLGDLYTQLAHPADAAHAYEAAAKIMPTDGPLLLNLAKSEKAVGDVPKAYAAAKQAASLLPDSAEANGEYGLFAARQRHDQEALAALHRSLDLDATSPIYRLALVSLEIDSLDFVRAEADLTPYLTAHPNDAEAHYYKAIIVSQKPRTPQNIADGLTEAELALPYRHHSPQIYPLLANLFLAANRPVAAYRVLMEGYKATPHFVPILRALVACETRLGRSQEAAKMAVQLDQEEDHLNQIEHFKEILGFNHKDIASGLALARLEEEIGRSDKALNYYSLMHQEAPNDPRIQAAWAAFLQRNKPTAPAH
jgi:Tfp pilus assembly protein PilF